MPEGFGGNEVFALDITTPFGRPAASRPAAAPVQLLWNTADLVVGGGQDHLRRRPGQDHLPAGLLLRQERGPGGLPHDLRLRLHRGHQQRRRAEDGDRLGGTGVDPGDAGQRPGSGRGLRHAQAGPHRADPAGRRGDRPPLRQPGLRNASPPPTSGDTWGNLFRYVPTTDASGNVQAGTGTRERGRQLQLQPSAALRARPSCSWTGTNATKSPGAIFIAQVTNSALDTRTAADQRHLPRLAARHPQGRGPGRLRRERRHHLGHAPAG